MNEEKLKKKQLAIKQCKLLVEAATKGDYTALVTLLEAGVSVDAEEYNKSLFYASQYYVTPLQVASQLNHVECVKELIKWGADVNCRDRFDVTAVHVAAENGNVDVLRELLDAGAECSVPTKFSKKHSYTAVPHIGGTTPLHLAANRNHRECVKELIQCGADYNAIDERGRTSLYVAAQNGFADCVMAHLQTAIGKDILSLPGFDSGDTPLHFAVQNAMVECVEALLEAGSDPNHVNYAGYTPLHYAVCPLVPMNLESAEKILHLLVLRGYNTDLNMVDRSGLTPLHYVALSSGVRLARRPRWAHFLIAYGANPDIKNVMGESLVEVEIRTHFDDLVILKAIVQSMLHPPILTFKPPAEELPPPPLAVVHRRTLEADVQLILTLLDMNEHMEEALFYMSHEEIMRKKMEWYLEVVQRPMPLQHYCRYSIRKAMGPKRLRHIKDLPIPNKMKSYLLLQADQYA